LDPETITVPSVPTPATIAVTSPFRRPVLRAEDAITPEPPMAAAPPPAAAARRPSLINRVGATGSSTANCLR
jgi:hypothetical protein